MGKISPKMIRGFSIPTRPTEMLEAIKTQSLFVQNPLEVTAAIAQDMALSARILSAANTLLTGHNRKVESVPCAMVLLGQEKVREITHELFLGAEIARRVSGMQTLRLQGIRAAHILSWLSQELATLSPHFKNGNLPVVPSDEAYVVGMFHDCGKMVLLRHGADYANLLTADRQVTRQTLEELEAEQYETTHAILGSVLCDGWQWPKPLVYLIEVHHHRDAFAGRPVSERKYLVLHAMLLMTEWLEGDLMEWEWERHRDYVQQLFALDDDTILHLREQARAGIPLAGSRCGPEKRP